MVGPLPESRIRPSTPGPAIQVTFSTPVTRALAAGSCSSGTVSRVAAASAGYDGVASTAATAATPTNNGTGQCSSRPAASTAPQPARLTNDQVSIELRDHRSANNPAYPEKITYGANPSATVTDTHRLDEVRSSTSMPTARVITNCATVPTP